MNIFIKITIPLSVILVAFQLSEAQNALIQIPTYNFINFEANELQMFGDSSDYKTLFSKFDNLTYDDRGQINIVHIGGSHIQAGYLTIQMSKRLQTFFPVVKEGRGFVFPFNMAKTNSPFDYQISYTGNWTTCKSTQQKKNCLLGLAGISATTYSEGATISISLVDNLPPSNEFNVLKVFHSTINSSFSIKVIDFEGDIEKIEHNNLGYTEFRFSEYVNKATLKFYSELVSQNHFVLYGLSLETTDPGIVYHAIGVNGASIPAYLRCDLLENQLKALSPDWIILTLGTNDAYSDDFNAQKYFDNYQKLIARIKIAVPEAAILLTVPNDSYLYKKRPNKNTALVRDEILKLAAEFHCAVWDFYSVMGGFDSIKQWQTEGLAQKDKLHLKKEGYFLQADLLINAFLDSYRNFNSEKQED